MNDNERLMAALELVEYFVDNEYVNGMIPHRMWVKCHEVIGRPFNEPETGQEYPAVATSVTAD